MHYDQEQFTLREKFRRSYERKTRPGYPYGSLPDIEYGRFSSKLLMVLVLTVNLGCGAYKIAKPHIPEIKEHQLVTAKTSGYEPAY